MYINRNNYEAWFLDYYEGRLSAEASAELFLFLNANPDLKEEFELFENIELPAEDHPKFPGKGMLKKSGLLNSNSINANNYEEYLIAETEGLLSALEISDLEKFIQLNPAVARDRQLYRLTRLQADHTVVFESKKLLEHKAIPTTSLDESNYEERMIAEVEGIITPMESDELQQFLVLNPHLRREYDLTSLTRLIPSNEIQFPGKEALKKPVMVPLGRQLNRFVYISLSAAAVLAVLLGLFFLLSEPKPLNQQAANSRLTPGEKNLTMPRKNTPLIITKPTTANETANIHVAKQTRKKENNIQTPVPSTGYPALNPAKTTDQDYLTASIPRNTSSINKVTMLGTGELALENNADIEGQFYRLSNDQLIQNEMLLNDIWLAQSVYFAELNAPDPNPGKTLLHAIASGVTDKYAEDLRSPEKRMPEHKFSGWTVAQVFVNAYNAVLHRNVRLDLQKDEDGRVISYAFKSDNLDFERPVGR